MLPNPDLIFESLSDALFVLDSNGVITSCNSAATTLTGFDKNHLLGLSFDLLSSESNDHIKNNYELSLVDKHKKLTTEGWRLKADGSRFWAETTFSLLESQDGKLPGYVCILRDTSAAKDLQLQLINREEQYRLLVEAVQDYAIFMLDPDGHICTWNEGGKNLTGYSTHEIVGKHFSIFYTPGDLTKKKPEIELHTARLNGSYQQEGWRIRKNGSLFWASIVVTAIVNENNQLIGFAKVTRDLTERLREEELLRQSEEKYRFLVEQVTDYAIFMLDEKGKIISWNEGAKKIKGYVADEIIGKYFSIFYPQEEIIKGKPSYELSIARSEGKYEEEGWRLRKDGTRFWASVVITAVYNNEKTLIGFSKVTRDLTERKLVEQEIKKTSENYRQIANEMKLVNQQLSDTNYELEQFTSVASHDLQEPLRTIKSFLHLIEKGLEPVDNPQLKSYVTKASAAADRMKDQISALLSYSQLNKSLPTPHTQRAEDLIEQALHNLKAAIDHSGAEISIEVGEQTIHGDSHQLVQLFQNLIGNAIKFTGGKRPQIKVGCQEEDHFGRFYISDNGIGLDPDSRDKIFEVFRRLHTASSYPGTGIGLAICKKVVERHQGNIWVESKPGSGSTFYFTLPRN